MGKVAYDIFIAGTVSLFVFVWFAVFVVMELRLQLGRAYRKRYVDVSAGEIASGELDQGRDLDPVQREVGLMKINHLISPPSTRKVSVIITCAKEKPEVFAAAMEKIVNQKGLVALDIIVVLDQFDQTEESTDCLKISRSFGSWVSVARTNARCKRTNLSNAVQTLHEESRLHPHLALMDSDTICDDEWVLARLCLAMEQDDTLGGVTTAQRAHNPNTVCERVGDWLEDARLRASMSAASLYGQVGCLPGRLYMVRSDVVADRIATELPHEVWTGIKPSWRFPFVRRWSAKAKAGDDRQITNYVLAAGYGTELVLDAGVTSLVPADIFKLIRTWRRWGTSSQGYCKPSRDLAGVLRKNRFIWWHYNSDIVISHLGVALICSWVYSFFSNDELLHMTTSTMLLISLVGVCLSFIWKQRDHLRDESADLLYLIPFVLIVSLGTFIRVQAYWTPWRIGVWGTRSGVDDSVEDVEYVVLYQGRTLTFETKTP